MEREYLVAHGLLGDFGRFRSAGSFSCRRGDRVLIRTPRGLELGHVLRDATPRHAHFLPNTTVGTLLRLANPDDELRAERLREQSTTFIEAATERAVSLELPLSVLDAEMLLDDHAVLHFVRWQECDLRPLVSGLSKQFDVGVLLQDLTKPHEEHHEHSCGSCGSEGGCGSCGSGGCGSGGCSTKSEETTAYFAGLREQMPAQSRVPLL